MSTIGPYWIERRVRAMGTDAHLIVGDAEPALVEWALTELTRLERVWSRFLPTSELAAVHAAAGTWATVSSTMLDALVKAGRLWAATDGLFDPTIRHALEAAGYDRTFGRVAAASPRPVPPSTPVAGFGTIEVDVAENAVRLPVGVTLDLGGLGKGLAADRLAEGLVDRGARTALVSIGGDLRAAGEPPAGGWVVPVEDPADVDRIAFEHRLRAGGLITTTRRIRTWVRAGRCLHHLIDPRTGTSSNSDVAAVVAAAGEAWWAEGIAKAALLAGSEPGAELLRRNGVGGWILRIDGQVTEIGSLATSDQRGEAGCSPR